MSMIAVAGVLTQLLLVAAPLVAMVLVGVLTRGRVRALGVAGFAILAVDALIGAGWLLVVPNVLRTFDLPLPLLASVFGAVRTLLVLVSTLLLAMAVVTDRTRPAR